MKQLFLNDKRNVGIIIFVALLVGQFFIKNLCFLLLISLPFLTALVILPEENTILIALKLYIFLLLLAGSVGFISSGVEIIFGNIKEDTYDIFYLGISFLGIGLLLQLFKIYFYREAKAKRL
ncbi:MAG: hypothetical protein ABIK92_16855 [Pseudomonadota bacterium]